MDSIFDKKDLLEGEQEKAPMHFSTDTSSCEFKDHTLSSSPPPPLSSCSLVQSSSMRPQTPKEVVHFLLALIREHYLQARPPQQIKELKNLFETIATVTSTGDQEFGGGDCAAVVDLSSIRKICTDSSTTTTSYTELGDDSKAGEKFDGMSKDLDRVGNKTEKDGKLCMNTVTTTASCGNTVEVRGSGISSCKKEEESNERKCSSIIASTTTNAQVCAEVLRGLYDVTIGYSPPLLADEEGKLQKEEEDMEMESFIHPPIQYRIAFAKYIIKQLELSRNWSAPQGSNEEDGEDSVERETLFLEKWYEGLESLSISGSRQVLSEPFYRLYEIKVARHNHKGSSGTSGNRTRANVRQGVVKIKILEHETSFVADGTTGLVTWKASTEFLKWLTSPWKDGGKLLLEKFGEGKEIEWVLELGCGCGFLAVALSKCIPMALKQYIATDGSLAALEKAKLNAEINLRDDNDQEKLIRNRIRFEKVDWQNEATRESFTQLVDGMTCIYGADKGLLLGADIIFDPLLIPDLVSLITDFIEAKAGKVIIACTIRNETTIQSFKDNLVSNGLSTRICGKWEDGEILQISRLSPDFN